MKSQISSNIKIKLQKIAKTLDLDFIIIFGSRAKNTANENSDYDIAFYKKDKNYDYDEVYDKIWEILEHKDLNLIDLNQDNSYFLEEEIFKSGVLICFKTEELFIERRNQTFFNYNDYKQYDYILEKII